MANDLWLVRHGETEWSLSGAHTGRTDIPLTEHGEVQAAALRPLLAKHKFALAMTSPLLRARRTCELAGFGEVAQVEPGLVEWGYGDYEGRTTNEIQQDRPGWSPFREGFPGGETIEEVGERTRAVIRRALAADGDVVVFAHGHVLRILTACWLELPPEAARLFAFAPARISTLGYERTTHVITSWNLVS